MKEVNIVGATGMVGREVTRQLLEDPGIDKVRIFVRRKSGLSHPRLEEHIVDFDHPENWGALVTGDALFSALGTTLKQAGSKEAQYRVDFTHNYQFAEAAARNGVATYVLVSAAGANARSLIFYSRIKGELDEQVQKLPFRHIHILRPSILTGQREVRRPAEEWSATFMEKIGRVMFRSYRPISAATVARAMINAALLINVPRISVFKPGELFNLAALNQQTETQ
ncbi:MAG TPA: NAD(P)H-binding protein [Prolixibacteraceae bacterium]|nr:NAD(P)H-binding protein [Prolixibacteraceae bacterium]HRV90302.1 NAD(P)H-binding protein [Prolixibacteraceae bacterium]